MATSNKDVKLRLSVETLGEEGVSKLRTAVLQLAKEGGEAAPEFQRLADEIDRLGAQGAALAQFQQLGEKTAELAREQAAAAQRVDELGSRLAAARTNAAGFAASQQQATDALRAAQLSVVGVSGEIVKLRSQYDTAGRSTDEYRNALAGLVDRQTAARAAVIEARAALADSNKEYGTAERQLKAVELAYGRADKAARDVGDAFASSTSALRDAEQAAEALGVSTDDVAQAQGQLATSFAKVATEAQELQYWLNAGAEALREQQAESQRAQQAHAEQLQSLNAEIRLRQQLATERAAAATATRAAAAAAEEEEQAQRAAAAAARAKADADQEMAEHNRLLAIQQAATNDLFRRSADALHQETAALREAAQAAALYEIAKEQQAAAERAAADEAEKAAARIASAFDKVGIQSVADLEREIQEVRAAMVTLRETAGLTGPAIDRAFAVGEQRIQALERDIREATGALTAADRAADLFRNSVGQIAAGNLVADAIGSMVERVKDLGREFITSIVALDQMRRGLNAVYKDTETTSAQIDFLRRTAGDAGVAVGGLSQEFVRFSAAMTSAGVPLQQSNDLFAALVASSAALGLGAEEVSGALNALGQMASKGTVSMEELRQQLGDRLPGAFGLVAQGLGITQAQLIKLVESGNLAARDLFPALTSALNTMRGETDGLVPTWERLKSTFTETAQAAGDAAWTAILSAGLKALAAAAYPVVMVLMAITEAVGVVAKGVGILVGAIATATSPFKALAEIVTEADKRINSLNDAFGRVVFGADAAAVASAGVAAATSAAGEGYVKLRTQMAEASTQQQQTTQNMGKAADATKLQGQTLIELARIQGDQLGILNASTLAAQSNADAAANVSNSRQRELDILQQQLQAFDQNAKARQLSEESVRTERGEIEKKIATAQVEVAQSQAAAEALSQEAAQRRLSAELYADNSKRVDEYGQAMARSVQYLADVQAAHQAGLLTDQDVLAARQQLAFATARYNDAVNDRAQREQRLIETMSASNQLEQAKLSLQMASLQSQAALARADGDTFKVRQLLIAQKELEIKMLNLAVAGQIAEQNAKIAKLRIDQAELDMSNPLNLAKAHAIDLAVKAAEAAILEARARGESVGVLERELQALKDSSIWRDNLTTRVRDGGPALQSDTNLRQQNTGAINQQTDALQRQLQLQQVQTPDRYAKPSAGYGNGEKPTNDPNFYEDSFGVERRRSDGAPKGTFSNTLPVDVANEIVDKMRTNALTADDLSAAQTAVQQATNSRQWLMATMKNSPGAVSIEAQQSSLALYNQARGALERVQSLVQMRDAESKTPAAAANSPATTSLTQTTNRTVTVKLQAPNGSSSDIPGLSESQAAAVIKALQQASRAAP